ncbi:porin [Xanthobacter sp. YC-JY1]|uniref:porin n=1 Tax=Xanthobacter sp. YC-JY1 TaxID=2419844 RepID=UPI001F3055E6|nr:porin [Xanthobacter sp. YC-JY1]UJX44993.1 porin [Xanthobacter sp. YC-JY1]
MKMVKSLLLGSAAGLVAVAGAQAADLPVKAKPVEYVKVCSAYGAGYFYIPGTDTCIKIGGYARFDTYVNAVGTFNPAISSTTGTAFNGPGVGVFAYPFTDGDDPDYLTRVRGVIDFDARTQTDYGTLRSYVRFGAEWNSQSGAGVGASNGLYFERAFIQFSGFTFGYTQSFFDPGVGYMLTTPYAGSNRWTTMLAYTAQFGNGFSATISLEDAANRTTGVQMTGSTATPVFNVTTAATGLTYTNYQGGQQAPDIVANLRYDGAWGTAQLSGALHQVVSTLALYNGFYPGMGTTSEWGWAIGGHVEFKLPMLAAGDSLFIQAGYEQGAVSYIGLSGTSQGQATSVGSVSLTQVGGSLFASGAFYTVADAVADLFGQPALTTGWAIQGQFRHYWTPGLRSALYAGYLKYEVPTNIVAAQNFNMWQVGVNTIWSPVKNLDIGAELLYSKVDGSVPLGQYAAVNAAGATIGSLVGGSTDIWSGGVRVQRNF